MLRAFFGVIPCLVALPVFPAQTPLRVVAVVRQGLPPYEEEDRLYRLEGPGLDTLKIGAALVLKRPGEVNCPGRLKVMEIHEEYLLAVLSEEGATYPLKGDLAWPIPPLPPLPPTAHQEPGEGRSGLSSLDVSRPVRDLPKDKPKEVLPLTPLPSSNVQPSAAKVLERVQPIYFLKESASLSPGAYEKLKNCVGSWGLNAKWLLGYPGIVGRIPELQEDRLTAVRAELQKLGVQAPEVRILPPEPPGKYDVVYVFCESQ